MNNSFWHFFINRRVAAWLVIIALIVMGSFYMMTLPREIQPEINIPFASITTSLPGATPTDVETLITKPIEEEIKSITDIKTYSSNSSSGFSLIFIEFEADADIDEGIVNLKDRVDFMKSNLPQAASEPKIEKAEIENQPIVNFSVSGETTLGNLTKFAKDLQAELKEINDVTRVDIVGGQKEYILINLDAQKVEDLGIEIPEIGGIINSHNSNFPLAIEKIDAKNYSFRIENRLKNLEEISELPIFWPPNNVSPLLLSDIADVSLTTEQQQVITKLTFPEKEPQNSVTLRLYKKADTNVISIVDEARTKVDEFQNNIPPEITISVTNDLSQFIRTDLGILVQNGIQTTIIIILIIFLALGFVEGLLAGLTIPLTLLATFILMHLQGSTINSLTLFSIVIALGIMVDTAIVIMEGIHENLKNGLKIKEAAIGSIETYKWPLVAGTLTTIFAFFPMLLVSGIVGQFLKSLPLTISAALLSSLFISILITPAIAIKFLKKGKIKTAVLEGFFNFLGRLLEKIISLILTSRLTRILIILTSIILFALSMMLPLRGILKVEMFPKTDIEFFILNIENPVGTTLEKTAELSEKISREISAIAEVDNLLTIIGTSQGQVSTDIVSFEQGANENLANITVNLRPKNQRNRKSYEVAEEIRLKYRDYPDSKISVTELSEGPPSDAPVTVNIIGENLTDLRNVVSRIEEIIKNEEGVINVEKSTSGGLQEVVFTFDKEKLALFGINPVEAAGKLRNGIDGIKVNELNLENNEEKTDLYIKYDIDRDENFIEILKNFSLKNLQGKKIKFGDIAKIELKEGLSSINRKNGERVISVSAEVEKNVNSIEKLSNVQSQIEKLDIPAGIKIAYGGETEEIEESFRELFSSMIIGIILIAITLVLMFNSLKQPFIIILTLPLALIGVFPGLFIIGLNLSFPAFLGVVALAGVVVNDAIVLIDRINQNRQKMEFKESIAEAVKARLQPIIMTSITTIAGIIPLALTNEFWAGLGFSLIFGLISSTLLTLFVIPVIYFALEAGKSSRT